MCGLVNPEDPLRHVGLNLVRHDGLRNAGDANFDSTLDGEQQEMAFLRPMLARLGPIHAYSTASRAAPLIVAFSTAAAKGSASDLIAQHRVEVKEQTDVRRNLT